MKKIIINSKIKIILGILVLFISSVFIVMKIREKPEFGTCETDADCKLVRCIGAYCQKTDRCRSRRNMDR